MVFTHHVIEYEQALEAFRGLLHFYQCIGVREVWLQRLLVDLFHQRSQQLAHIRLLTNAHPQDFLKRHPYLVVIDNFDGHRGFA